MPQPRRRRLRLWWRAAPGHPCTGRRSRATYDASRRTGQALSPRSNPGLLVGDLLGRDGPYLAAAEAFLACRCARCGRGVERTAVQFGDAYLCPSCWLQPAARFAAPD